jgi:hypothetical protein
VREDEIEALLKFMGGTLAVHKDENDLFSKIEPFTAIITGKDKKFARSANTRLEAVHAVWKLYQDYIEVPLDKQDNLAWLIEHAHANVADGAAAIRLENPKWLQKQRRFAAKQLKRKSKNG